MRLREDEQMHVAYIGLGSNLSDRKKNILRAISELRRLGGVRVSPLYETAPLAPAKPSDPLFLNCVAELRTGLPLRQLIERLKKFSGRKLCKGAPREIDVDLLLYDNFQGKVEGVRVPHARMLERRFVLLPLSKLAPKLEIKGKSLQHYLRKASKQRVVKV